MTSARYYIITHYKYRNVKLSMEWILIGIGIFITIVVLIGAFFHVRDNDDDDDGGYDPHMGGGNK